MAKLETIYVTGGSGYLGRNIIRQFVSKGHSILALARSDASASIVASLGATPVLGDILDEASLSKGMIGADWVIHAAADTAHGMAEMRQHQSNLEGTKNVFVAAKLAGVQRAIHISTEAVLVAGKPLINVNESMPIPKRHAGGYSQSKAAAELMAISLTSTEMPIIILRPRFVWGRDDTTALPQLVAAARSGKLKWIDGGHYLTSTTHIDNVVEGIRLALEKGRGGEAYFITDGKPVEFRHFVSQMLNASGTKPSNSEIPRWLCEIVIFVGSLAEKLTAGKFTSPLSMQEYGTVGMEVTLDISKAQSELGYRPIISIESGLKSIVT
jgi:nucleoside-diphosphate-sugar epimerase